MEENTTHVSLVRPGNEDLLHAELTAAGARCDVAEGGGAGSAPAAGAGWRAWQAAGPSPPAPLVFERQRMARARFVAEEAAVTLADAVAGIVSGDGAPGGSPPVLHVFAADPTGVQSLARRAQRVQTLLCARVPALEPDVPAVGGRTVWQVCVVPGGAWCSRNAASELADPYPGGVHRMQRDPAAPSRSYLKLEEALDVLGHPPKVRERVIDLGAAPGGWSYAFLKRGCRVLAVDNGPLKLGGLDALPGQLTHLRADGLRLRPPSGWLPADWLLSDMLVPPGQCLGLLRRWLENGWTRRFIVNVKLPQREPLAALAPLQAYLGRLPTLSWRMRQLYHDRREVTIVGCFARLPTLQEGGGPSRPDRRPPPQPRRRASPRKPKSSSSRRRR